MKTLLILACTANKLDERAAAIDLYQGRQFTLVRDNMAELLRADVVPMIFSAEHGLVAAVERIDPYDRKLTELRSKQMSLRFGRELHKYTPWADSVAVYGGKLYRDPIRYAFGDCADLPVEQLVGAGRGCGDHYAALVDFVFRHTGRAA